MPAAPAASANHRQARPFRWPDHRCGGQPSPMLPVGVSLGHRPAYLRRAPTQSSTHRTGRREFTHEVRHRTGGSAHRRRPAADRRRPLYRRRVAARPGLCGLRPFSARLRRHRIGRCVGCARPARRAGDLHRRRPRCRDDRHDPLPGGAETARRLALCPHPASGAGARLRPPCRRPGRHGGGGNAGSRARGCRTGDGRLPGP